MAMIIYTRDFLRHGGIIIQGGEEVKTNLKAGKAGASYLPDFNTILFLDDATITEVLEETYHAKQDRIGMFSNYSKEETHCLREIDAQHYLLSLQKKV